jgi:cytochrome c oxidase assembly protein subunit 19
MARDEFKNLGFGEDKPAETKDDAGDQGKKGELRW